MEDNMRALDIDGERCIGCRACATVCPAGLIALSDDQGTREVRFAPTCSEPCDRCVEACPTGAIRLEVGGVPAGAGTVLRFGLVQCAVCTRPLAPAGMLAYVQAAVPASVQVDAGGEAWLVLCPACRRREEARRMAHQTLMGRPQA